MRYIITVFIVFLLLGFGYGIYKDFSPAEFNQTPIEHEQKYEVLPDGRIKPLTKLDKEGMKIQEQEGCAGCH